MISLTRIAVFNSLVTITTALDTATLAESFKKAFECDIARYEDYTTRLDHYLENGFLPAHFSMDKVEEAWDNGQRLWCEPDSPCKMTEDDEMPSYIECRPAKISMRAINPFLLAAYAGGYGCWCYFGDGIDNPLSGSGDPIDEVDLKCKVLTEGYKCIQDEFFEENGQDCEPWSESYDIMVACNGVMVNGIEMLGIACGSIASSEYIKKVCTVETYFTVNAFAASFSADLNQVALYRHDNDDFDVAEHCRGTVPIIPDTTMTPYVVETATTVLPVETAEPIPCPDCTGTGAAPQVIVPPSSPVVNVPSVPSNTVVVSVPSAPAPTPVVHRFCCGTYPHRSKITSYSPAGACCGSEQFDTTTHKCCGTTAQVLLGENGGGIVTPIDDEC